MHCCPERDLAGVVVVGDLALDHALSAVISQVKLKPKFAVAMCRRRRPPESDVASTDVSPAASPHGRLASPSACSQGHPGCSDPPGDAPAG